MAASLAGFDKLEKVCVDASVFFETTPWSGLHNLLPASLTYLRLENTWPTLMCDFEERDSTSKLSVLESTKPPFPALRTIDIMMDEGLWAREVEKVMSSATSFRVWRDKVRYLDPDHHDDPDNVIWR
jgi:hypothetical protein